MTHKTSLICVTCPMGCSLEVTVANGEVTAVEGNACKRGLSYAQDELVNPRRVVSSTVLVTNGLHPLLPVYTDRPFPKNRIVDLLRALQGVVVTAPVRAAEVILADALGTGIQVLASRDMPRKD